MEQIEDSLRTQHTISDSQYLCVGFVCRGIVPTIRDCIASIDLRNTHMLNVSKFRLCYYLSNNAEPMLVHAIRLSDLAARVLGKLHSAFYTTARNVATTKSYFQQIEVEKKRISNHHR